MPSLKDRDLKATSELSSTGNTTTAEESGQRQQTIALEVPVMVNGARPLDGSDRREPFSESTKTILVHAQGAVIRLSSGVAAGQLVFLRNEKSGKEVVCQVVKSKSRGDSRGYVELQFTHPVAGFWGMRFPGPGAVQLRNEDGTHAVPASPRDAWSDELSRVASESQPMGGLQTDSQGPDASTTADPESYMPELKPTERASNRAQLLTMAEDPGESPNLEGSRSQQHLASRLLNEQTAEAVKTPESTSAVDKGALSDATARLFAMGEAGLEAERNATKEIVSPAPKVTTNSGLTSVASIKNSGADLGSQLKVPTWLEPLARNVADTSDEAKSLQAKPPASVNETAQRERAAKTQAKEDANSAARSSRSPEAATMFGRTLLPQNSAKAGAAAGSNRGLMIAGIAAAVLAAAALGTMYWQEWPAPSKPNKGLVRPPASSPAPSASTVITPDAAGAPAEQTAAATGSQVSTEPAVITERIPKISGAETATSNGVSAVKGDTEAAPDVQPSKPTLGKVRLAKPKVRRSKQPGGVDQPVLSDTDAQALSPDSSMNPGFAIGESSQPAAPSLPVGGDVHPARLISSTPPAYPEMAKVQRISGEVRIDALIDAKGHVSSMKVISGPGLLHQAAMDAVRQWKYQPATLNGNAVPMHLTVSVQFHLD